MMLYSYEKPGKIRMDIEKPRKGAVLIYNPEQSRKVRVRPFPGMSLFKLKFDLNDEKVKSDSGGTIDRSDLGSRLESFCAELAAAGEKARVAYDEGGRPKEAVVPEGREGRVKTYRFGEEGLLRKIEVTKGGMKDESYEWTDLKLNLKFKPDLFKKF